MIVQRFKIYFMQIEEEVVRKKMEKLSFCRFHDLQFVFLIQGGSVESDLELAMLQRLQEHK
jgi:hypothetical protein